MIWDKLENFSDLENVSGLRSLVWKMSGLSKLIIHEVSSSLNFAIRNKKPGMEKHSRKS